MRTKVVVGALAVAALSSTVLAAIAIGAAGSGSGAFSKLSNPGVPVMPIDSADIDMLESGGAAGSGLRTLGVIGRVGFFTAPSPTVVEALVAYDDAGAEIYRRPHSP